MSANGNSRPSVVMDSVSLKLPAMRVAAARMLSNNDNSERLFSATCKLTFKGDGLCLVVNTK